jgi:hypothetical protein
VEVVEAIVVRHDRLETTMKMIDTTTTDDRIHMTTDTMTIDTAEAAGMIPMMPMIETARNDTTKEMSISYLMTVI